MIVSIIVAVSQNGVIGKNNKLLWKLSDDLKRFKKITSGHHVIMGRKTYQSIGKPLSDRMNIIISRTNLSALPCDCIYASSLDEALQIARQRNEQECFVIGGGEVYKKALPQADKLYITHVHHVFDGDTFFHCDLSAWKLVSSEYIPQNKKNEYDSTFCIYIRK
ncbi:MAG: dihydrofolate reductase [Cytophagaceae bacterium]|nr:dihydrofolate reductase [Cytophagaceae bacterium]MDW8455350.1 dihydrofolate reductase [Cytophagaceae bacterium]